MYYVHILPYPLWKTINFTSPILNIVFIVQGIAFISEYLNPESKNMATKLNTISQIKKFHAAGRIRTCEGKSH